ncbi:MAG: tRNA (5-methylaminomethyl-2-thiouridine)(34)-methyltransferase MnmD [Flavobacteriales bacterium]|nr:tRNA (5-methylaminomethyl-2-thiouridine)(34)-methyltransferase MnmD [Flavobacteriales bacterium]MCB9167551.1 tRNA (5-methylaminomethyl-2-thiouridine)(34)-methyltransferase MnmD [Flavobacteriales bacterium]
MSHATVAPGDLRPVRTADGSFTLRHERLDEHYHSVHGAVRESQHVFLRNGLHAVDLPRIDLLEIGLGTGLNALLTFLATRVHRCTVHYTALEPFPVSIDLLRSMDHCAVLGVPDARDLYEEWMMGGPGVVIPAGDGFHFRRLDQEAGSITDANAFDLIYFDAFAPEKQPGLWTEEMFQRMHKALRPGGVLVTYCAKGQVRRNMVSAGLQVERLPGPPGKREMLRARRPKEVRA